MQREKYEDRLGDRPQRERPVKDILQDRHIWTRRLVHKRKDRQIKYTEILGTKDTY